MNGIKLRRPPPNAIAAAVDDLQLRLISDMAARMRSAGIDEAEIVSAADDARLTIMQFRKNIEAIASK